MQFNLHVVNDREQVAQFVWRDVALRGSKVRVYQYFGGVPAAFFSVCVCYLHVGLFRGVFWQF